MPQPLRIGFSWTGDRPQQLAVEVVGEEADVAERHVDALSVGDRRLRRVGVLQMPRRGRNAAMRFVLPRDLPGGEIDRVDHPAMFDLRRGPLAAEVEAAFRRFDLSRRNHRRDEDAIAPRDRRRPAVSGNRRLPANVLGGAPRVRKTRGLGDAGRARSAKLRPLFGSISDRGTSLAPAQAPARARYARDQHQDDEATPGDLHPWVPAGRSCR